MDAMAEVPTFVHDGEKIWSFRDHLFYMFGYEVIKQSQQTDKDICR